MFAIDAVTLYSGCSMRGMPTIDRFRLKSEEGREYLQQKAKCFKTALENGKLTHYKQFLKTEFHELEREIADFIFNDDKIKKFKMNDLNDNGWAVYNELMDKYNICKYFLERKEHA